METEEPLDAQELPFNVLVPAELPTMAACNFLFFKKFPLPRSQRQQLYRKAGQREETLALRWMVTGTVFATRAVQGEKTESKPHFLSPGKASLLLDGQVLPVLFLVNFPSVTLFVFPARASCPLQCSP